MIKKTGIKIYLSGKITGVKDLNKPKFEAAEKLLITCNKYKNVYVHVYNPHKLDDKHDKSWGGYMRECINALTLSDEIYMLDDWRGSRGALVELFVAKCLNIPIYSIETLDEMEVSFRQVLARMFFKFLKK